MEILSRKSLTSTAHHAQSIVCQLIILATMSAASHADFTTLVQHGTPLFEPGGFARASVPYPGHAPRDERLPRFEELQNEVFGTLHSSTRVDDFPTFVPGDAHSGPYDLEPREGLARLGVVNTSSFTADDYRWPTGVYRLYNLVPIEGAPMGASPDSPLGPIIPNDIFPLSIEWTIHRDGSELFRNNQTLASLDSLGTVTDIDGVVRDFTGLSYSHIPRMGIDGYGCCKSDETIAAS